MHQNSAVDGRSGRPNVFLFQPHLSIVQDTNHDDAAENVAQGREQEPMQIRSRGQDARTHGGEYFTAARDAVRKVADSNHKRE